MGLLDSYDFDAMLKKILEGQAQPDSKAPISQGLMAMGAQMLANSHRGFGNALGAGGLGYLEASNAERARQQKDPMAQLNMANAVMAMQDRVRNNKEMDAWQRQLSGAPQAAPSAPQFGMQDRSMGEMSAAAPMAGGQPGIPTGEQGQQPPPALLLAAMRSRNPVIAKQATELHDRLYKPFELASGQKRYAYGPDGMPMVAASNVDTTKPQIGPDGQAAFVPGAAEEQARLEALKQKGAEQAKAELAVIQVPDGQGGKVNVLQSQEVARLQGAPQGETAPPKDLLTAMDELKKRGVATRWTPQTGLVMGDAALQPPPQLGRERSPVESAEAMIPVEAQKAAAVQSATAAGKAKEALTADSYKTQLADLKESYKSANTAKEVLASINESREALEKGAITGGFGKGKIAGLNMINGMLPAAYQIAPGLLGNSQRLASSLGQQLVKHAKDLGFNPSNADATRLEKVIGDEGVSEKGIKAILDFQEKMARQGIDQHNKIAKQASEKGALPLFEYNVDAPEPYKTKASQPPGEPPAKGAQWDGSAWTMTQMIGGKPKLFKWVP